MGSGNFKKLFKKESSTEEEIKQLVEEDTGELEVSQRQIISNVFEFDDTNAGDIMTHRTDVAAVEDTQSLYDVVKIAIDEGFSRIPVFHEDLDNILGIVYVKDLLKFIGKKLDSNESISDYVREPLFVPETIPCGKLFAKMTETRIQLAIVVDEYGGTAGIVTLEDVIEELVGDIEDEYDEEEESVKKLDDNTYIVDGIIDIDDAQKLFNIDFPDGDYDTLAGFVISKLGFIPSNKDVDTVDVSTVIDYNGVKFEILKIEDRRIDKIKVILSSKEQ